MAFKKMEIIPTTVALLVLISLPGNAQLAKRPFTVADDIAYSHFIPDGYSGAYFGNSGMGFSPNGEFFFVLTGRGRLDLDKVEESLRFYRTRDMASFLENSDQPEPPSPVWVVNRSGKQESIRGIYWLADSRGVAIQEQAEGTVERLFIADLRTKTVEPLPTQVPKYSGFAISDSTHYVYVAEDEGARREVEKKREAEGLAPAAVVTSTTIWDVILGDNPNVISAQLNGKKHLWAVTGGKAFLLKINGNPAGLSEIDEHRMALSPDGQTLIMKLRIKDIPQSWDRLYPPPYANDPDSSIHAGGSAMQYVRVDLKTGSVQSLTAAPVAEAAGWYATSAGTPVWSGDGHAVLLPGTFVKRKDDAPARPCIAVVEIASNTVSCVEEMKGRKGSGQDLEEGYHGIQNVSFIGGDQDHVAINFVTYANRDESAGHIEYRRASDGTWRVTGQGEGWHTYGPANLDVSVKEGLAQQPLLVVANLTTSRTLLDPNPQFKDLDLGAVKVYAWKDKEGRPWTGGLYLPGGYRAGERYPLVIQTHGFSESVFYPSGSYPAGFAARELASAGIAVLQVGGSRHCGGAKADEAACEVRGFDSALRQLVSDGLVDPTRVGYIGFSRSCWYGLEMLTNGSQPLKAALLDDGITVDFLQFVLFAADAKDEIGAKPIGEGLEVWMKRSPGFRMEKVSAPVMIQSEYPIAMWQPYAVLRYLNKPVDMIKINSDEHPYTNPAVRMASQGGSVDWFRFWLQGHEDPDPAKAEQYKRWRELRKLQAGSEKKSVASPVGSN